MSIHTKTASSKKSTLQQFVKNNQNKIAIGLVLLATAIILIISINAKSLWGDECLIYKYINSPNPLDVFKKALESNGSEKQMPLFLLFSWVWTRIFGLSEIAMRSVNVLPAFLYAIYGYKISQKVCKKKLVWLGVLFFLLNPIFVAYLNEARPYIGLLAFALAIIYHSFYAKDFNSKRNIFAIHLFMLLGISFHLLFIFSFVIYLCGILYHRKNNELKLKDHIKGLLLCSPFYLLLLVYMAFTFIYSSSMSIGFASGSVFSSLVVSLYYIAGFGGLGPSRNDLRNPSLSDLTPFMIIAIVALAIVLLPFFITLIKKSFKKPFNTKTFWLLMAGVALLACFSILAIAFKYSFWERHIIALSAIFITLIVELIPSKKMFYPALALLILFAISSLNYRFNYYYGNEDYKSIVNDLGDGSHIVMAQGAEDVFDYYGKELVKSDNYTNPTNQIIDISNYSVEQINDLISQYQYQDQYKDKDIAIVLTSRPVSDKNQLYHNVNSFNLPDEEIVEYRGLECFTSN